MDPQTVCRDRAVIDILLTSFLKRTAQDQDRARFEAEVFLDDQELRSGLLVSRGLRSYRFVHLTFQEYLAAWELTGRSDYWTIITPYLRDPTWFETLQLLGGILAQQGHDEALSRYLDQLLAAMGDSISGQAPIIALCANIVRDTADIAELELETSAKYEAALRSTLGVFNPAEKVPEKTQLEVLAALAGLGKAVKDQLISATQSQHQKVRSRALALLVPHLPDDDLFGMTHILADRSKETIKTYVSALLERHEARTGNVLAEVAQPNPKLSDAVAELNLFPVLPSFEALLACFDFSNHFGATVQAYMAEFIRRDEAKTGTLLGDSRYWTGPILLAMVKLSRPDIFDDESLFAMMPKIPWRQDAKPYIEAALERDEAELRSRLKDSDYWTDPILLAMAKLSRLDMFDDESLFAVMPKIPWRQDAKPYIEAALERDEAELRSRLKEETYWTGPILEALAELSRLDLLD